MRAKSTSGLPGHTPTPPTDTPPDTPAVAAAVATSTVDVQRIAWLLIADGLVQGCPCPRSLSTRPGSPYVFLYPDQAGDIAPWAAFLGLGEPSVSTYPDDTRPLLITATSAYGNRDGLRWSLHHHTHEPLPDAPGDQANDHAGKVGGGE